MTFDPTYPLFPIFAFIGFVAALIPLPWHLQAWNSGTCFYMIWASLACLNQFVNSVIWAHNAINVAPIWCDISTRIILGSSVGLPAASLCINRRLYQIASVQCVAKSPAEKRRAILVDSLICILFPLLFVALQIVVQGHRFDIFEGIGCYPVVYNTPLAYPLSAMWPIVVGLISATYCILSLRSFSQRRLEFGQFLAANKSLTIGRYFRLMALATTEIMLTTPLAIFMMWLNATSSPIQPWISWEDTHFDFSRVELVPAIIWRNGPRLSVVAIELSRWLTPLCGLLFFGFFGFAEEAKRNYCAAFWFILRPFGMLPKTTQRKDKLLGVGSSNISGPIKVPLSSLPSYSPPSSPSTYMDIKRPNSFTSSFGDADPLTPLSVSTSSTFPRSSMDTVASISHDLHGHDRELHFHAIHPSSSSPRSSLSAYDSKAGPLAP